MADDVVRGSASAVVPPFVVLAVAVVVTVLLGFVVAGELHGGMSFSQFAPVIVGDAFALFALVFVWLDTALAMRREGRPWVGAAQSWRSSGIAALVALVICAALSVPIIAIMAALVQAHIVWPALVGVPALLLLGAGIGVRANVRIRRRTPVGPPAPF